jgi:hypothetical protein
MPRALMIPVLLPFVFAFACAEAKVHESNKQWTDGKVVALNMCAPDRSAKHTDDPPGQRVYCAIEELVGSHIPKCVCRDEAQAAQQRAEADEFLRQAQKVPQPGSDTSQINTSQGTWGSAGR